MSVKRKNDKMGKNGNVKKIIKDVFHVKQVYVTILFQFIITFKKTKKLGSSLTFNYRITTVFVYNILKRKSQISWPILNGSCKFWNYVKQLMFDYK